MWPSDVADFARSLQSVERKVYLSGLIASGPPTIPSDSIAAIRTSGSVATRRIPARLGPTSRSPMTPSTLIASMTPSL